MNKKIITVLLVLVAGTAGYLIAKEKPRLAIDANLAEYTIQYKNPVHFQDLHLVTLHYNDVSIPCVIARGSAAISCAWTPEAIAELSTAGKK